MAGKVIDATLRFVDKFTRPLGQAMGNFQNHTRQITKAGKQIENAGKSISKVGSSLTKAVTVPIVGIATASIKTAADFQEGMSKVQSISGATAKEMEVLTAKAKEMGAKTKFSARESADAFSYMAMAGWKTEDMLNSIEAVMYLAGAAGEDLALTSDIVTDAMTAFGLAANKDFSEGVSNAAHFSNVLAAAANASNTNVAMLGESFKYAAPVAGALGYTVDDTAIALGLMANSGIKASQSGTAMRGAFANLVNPTDKMSAAMDRLGLSVTNEDGSMKTLKQTMDMLRSKMGAMSKDEKDQAMSMLSSVDTMALAKSEMEGLAEEEINAQTALGLGLEAIKSYDEAQLNSALSTEYTKKELAKMTAEEKRNIVALEQGRIAMEGLTEAEQVQASATIFGKNAMAGMLAIINASEEDYKKLSLAIESCDTGEGAARTMYNIANDNLNGRITILKSSLESVAITLGEKLMPHVEKAVAWIQKMVDAFSRLDDKTVGTIMKIAGIAAVVGPVLLVFGKVITTVGKIVTVIGKVGKAIKTIGSIVSLVTSPVGIAIAVVVGVIAIGTLLVKNWDKIKKAAGKLGEGIKSAFSGIKNFVTGIFSSLLGIVKAPFNAIIGLVNGVIGAINKIGFTVPKWVPLIGGKEFKINIPKIPMLAKGTKNWQGGLAMTQEAGGEIMDLPKGTRVYPHDESLDIARKEGAAANKSSCQITINKLADTINVRNDDDIDRITDLLVKKLVRIINNGGGEEFA